MRIAVDWETGLEIAKDNPNLLLNGELMGLSKERWERDVAGVSLFHCGGNWDDFYKTNNEGEWFVDGILTEEKD